MQTLIEKIKCFNETREYLLFEEIMNELYPNATCCKDCGKHILYYDTIFGGFSRKSRKTGNIEIYLAGKSFLTKKTHGETLQVCEHCLKQKFPSYKQRRIFNNITDITVYAFNIQDRSKYFTGPTKERCIRKHGEEKGLKVWNDYRKRQAETNTFKYKNKKYGMSKEEFESFNKSRAVTLENLIKKHGEELGNKRWNDYVNRQKETKSIDYMIKKFGEEKARKINKSKSLTLENFIRKYGDEVGIKKYEQYYKNLSVGYSKISQDFFDKLDVILGKKYETFYATKNYEYTIPFFSSFIKLDYFIKNLNICVEFNGDIFHANPKKFKLNDTPNFLNKSLTAKQIWEADAIRYKFLKKEHGINTIIVWESELKTLDIKTFINNILNK